MNVKEAVKTAEDYSNWKIGDSTEMLSHKDYIKAVGTLISHAKSSVEYKHSDNPTFVKVLNRVAAVGHITPDFIKSKSQKENAVAARQVICYVMRSFGFIYADIGYLLGNRDHSTMLYARKKLLSAIQSPVEKLRKQNPELAKYAEIINDYKVGGYE